MCGIAVSFSQMEFAPALDLSLIAHRGPDACGEWRSADGRCWMGHARLAILDLSPTGAQPMHDPETGSVIAFNGEIYNFHALRSELEQKGIRFRGTGDTETLLAGYRIWREKVVDRLKGMFAFVIYDSADGSLFGARDRLGIKPLYYKAEAEGISLASETRILRGASQLHPDRQACADFIRRGFFSDSNLLDEELCEIPAGHFFHVKREGRLDLQPYWPEPRVFKTNGQRDPARTVRELLERSVEEHLVSDVPVASFLSGGIDSTVITGLAAKRIHDRLCTFSVGFKEKVFDETDIAGRVAERFGTTHVRIELSEKETLELVREGIERMDLPSVDALNTYIVARTATRQGIKVALSGLGADELFGGYPIFREFSRLMWLARLPRVAKKAFGLMGHSGKRLADLPDSSDPYLLAIWRRQFWSADAIASATGNGASSFPANSVPDLPDGYARVSWAELTNYMRNMLLRDADQMCMAVGLELRVPFLDHELVEYALSLPAGEKLRGSYPKGLLIEACQDILPDEVYQRPKMGFALPMREWMQGPLQESVREGIESLSAFGLLREEWIAKTMQEFQAGTIHWTRVWTLVVLGFYLRKHAHPASHHVA